MKRRGFIAGLVCIPSTARALLASNTVTPQTASPDVARIRALFDGLGAVTTVRIPYGIYWLDQVIVVPANVRLIASDCTFAVPHVSMLPGFDTSIAAFAQFERCSFLVQGNYRELVK